MDSDPTTLKSTEPSTSHAFSIDLDDPYEQYEQADASVDSDLLLDSHIKTIVTSLTVDHRGTTVYFKGRQQPTHELSPLLFIHDIGEHSGLYRDISSKFLALGYSVYGYDLRGHGRSGRRMGHAPSFSSMVKDLLQVAAWVKHQEMGHSPMIIAQGIGALIAMQLAAQHPSYCQALALCAPSIEPVTKTTWYQRFLIRACADLLPLTRLPLKMIPKFAEQLKHSERHSEAMQKISFFPRITAILTDELLHAIKLAQDGFFKFSGPTLVLCPTADNLYHYHSVKAQAQQLNNPNIQCFDVPHSGHHILTECNEGRDIAITILKEWLHKNTLQVAAASSSF